MPTISQLPVAGAISPADEVPISQAGAARAASVGALLSSAQPVIMVESPSLLGRTSLGSGGPEQIDIGIGVTLSAGTLIADGLDHAAFPLTSSLSPQSDLVISNQGSPMLMQASLMRGLFSAGQNVAIDVNGVISATCISTGAGTVAAVSSIGALQVITQLAAQDLVPVSHSGSEFAISYGNFLGGITIDQAQPAAAVADSDRVWVAQASNVMASQNFGAIWTWIAARLPTYKTPVIEITTNTTLNAALHNRCLLICSQPVTLTPLVTSMGSGFQCIVLNASNGNLTLGSGFVSSTGSLVVGPWQSATLWCATYSAGTLAFAAMPTTAASTTISPPGQVVGLSSSVITTSAITVSWQAPSTGGAVASYIVQYRLTGATSWTNSTSVVGATNYQLTALQAATSYDIVVQAQNTAGTGTASSILTAATSTMAASQSVNSITWNLLPSGTYVHGTGSIGINAQISPVSSPVQFGFSLSASTPPTSWTAAVPYNNLWAQYVPTPPTAGNWYVWGEGLDGSGRTVSPTPFVVQ